MSIAQHCWRIVPLAWALLALGIELAGIAIIFAAVLLQ